ncbi:dihydrodipicolinate synthase family protein [Truepera radiovictrix]|nr:dihydrodipicolinate synthase family protein [Truepera radiovictrix]WMT57678.1 dihydrodipicolinate synthase family protein [Truepera radiovictrix]
MTLQGIFPPLPTPFTAAGELDLDGLQGLIAALEPLVDGFLVLGSNGEAVYLTEAERRLVLEAARAAIPTTKPMLAGTGGEATCTVLKRNCVAAEVGADAVLVLPPHYYLGAMNEVALRAHYRTLADESPLPVLLYNVPANTTLSLSPNLVGELAGHGNVVGLKDSSGNLVALGETLRRVGPEFAVLTGNAPTLLPALSLGAWGGILAVANVAPALYAALLRRFKAGDLEGARALQLALDPLALAVTVRFGVAGLKAALRLQGLPAGYPRAPLQDVSREVLRELEGLLEGVRALAAPSA